MPQISERILNYYFSEIDAVTLTAGANDFRMIPSHLGDIQPNGSKFDRASTIGSLQTAIEFILKRNPSIKIFIITPIKGWNGLEVMPATYPYSFKKVAELYSLPICDWYYESGINELTKTVYIGDIKILPYELHPTNAGFRRMADVLIPCLESY